MRVVSPREPFPRNTQILNCRYCEMQAAVLLIVCVSPWIPATFGINLVQEVPKDILACPGSFVRFMCTSETGVLGWSEDGDNHVFNSPNSPDIVGDEFIFELVSVTGNTFFSTARNPNISTADHGKVMGCFDDNNRMFQSILVTVQPANCQGTVSCTANPSFVDSSLTVISVSLVPPSGQSCVEGYEFVFGNFSEIVGLDSPAANFTIDKNLGLEYVNPQIFTLNAENMRGTQPCTFSITEPSAILQVTGHQECNQTTMDISVFLDWDRPSLPVGNCLDASHLRWMYRIQVLNFDPSEYETSETHLTINGFPSSGEYSMMITPVLPDLGLSGPPLNSTIVLNQTCTPLSNTPKPSSNTAVLAIVVVFPVLALTTLLVMILLTLICRYYWISKKDSKANCVVSEDPAGYVQHKRQSPDLKKYETSNISLNELELSGDDVNGQELLAQEKQRLLKLQEENNILIQEKQQTAAAVAHLEKELEGIKARLDTQTKKSESMALELERRSAQNDTRGPGLSGDKVNVYKLLAMQQRKVLKLKKEKDILIQEKQQTGAYVADLQRKLGFKNVVQDQEDSGYGSYCSKNVVQDDDEAFDYPTGVEEENRQESDPTDVEEESKESEPLLGTSKPVLGSSKPVLGSSILPLLTWKNCEMALDNKEHKPKATSPAITATTCPARIY